MASPVEIIPPPDPGFDPLAFWIEHQKKVIAAVGIICLLLVSWGVYQLNERRSREAAQSAFANAKTTDDYRKVIADHPRSVVAANAQLLMAEALRKEGKLDEAVALLRKFTEGNTTHPMISGAWHSLAVTLEAQGKTEEALATYQKVATTYQKSYSAPLALLAQARIHAKSQPDQARRLYEQVLADFGQTNFAREALMEMQKLKGKE